jgi:hypothetical protein
MFINMYISICMYNYMHIDIYFSAAHHSQHRLLCPTSTEH